MSIIKETPPAAGKAKVASKGPKATNHTPLKLQPVRKLAKPVGGLILCPGPIFYMHSLTRTPARTCTHATPLLVAPAYCLRLQTFSIHSKSNSSMVKLVPAEQSNPELPPEVRSLSKRFAQCVRVRVCVRVCVCVCV